ncbi:MAG: SulP family inorganic anion transporter [Gammaproteobacteria bacterium]|jgi:SulP family sulfate permease|nr:SulP family inorganic anion transporter [Gammaproteobacteria bacterium]
MIPSLKHLRGDIYGGITTGIVALPLALAFGVASGAGPIAGLYGAIFVGFLASLFGGTPTNISGPTGPMVVVFAGLFASMAGRPELVFTAVMLAGLMQVLFGVLKFGQYIQLVPYPVVSGFMSGIGVIIVVLQIGRLLGAEPPGDVLGAMLVIPDAIVAINWQALIIGATSLIVGYAWPARYSKFLPGALAALVAGTVISLFLPGAPILGDIPSGLPQLQLPSYDHDSAYLVVEAALILAVLGSIDSLLTSLVADNMTRSKHDPDKELIGQGIGNGVAGLFGGLPGAGATMRTVVNIRAGGMTNLSGMIHAVLLLLIVFALGPLAEQIPHAALAGILVKVGIDIVDWGYLKTAHRGPRWDLVLMVLVLLLTVFVDLITAVAVGVVLAALAFVRQVAQLQLKRIAEHPKRELVANELELIQQAGGRINVFDFGGPLSFGAAANMGHQIRTHAHDDAYILILDFSRVPFLDVSSARAIADISHDAYQAGRHVYVAAMHEDLKKVLRSLQADKYFDQDKVFPTRLEALQAAVAHVQSVREGAAAENH